MVSIYMCTYGLKRVGASARILEQLMNQTLGFLGPSGEIRSAGLGGYEGTLSTIGVTRIKGNFKSFHIIVASTRDGILVVNMFACSSSSSSYLGLLVR